MTDVYAADDVEALVLASRDGNQRAWGALVERLSPLVWGVARSYGLDHQDSVDVSQTTWLQFARHVGSLQEPKKAPGWLATTARRECLRMVKAQRRETATSNVELAMFGAANFSDSDADADAERRILWDAVNSLQENCRLMVRMFLADPPPSYETVAESLGISVNAVGPKRSRCLSHLRTVLDERFREPQEDCR